MVIGAAIGQVPLIQKARAMGLNTVAVSVKGNYPGFREADECAFIDINDVGAIADFGRKKAISAVVTDQSDVTLPPAALVCEKLGLPGVPFRVVSLFTNKIDMRQHSFERGVRVPNFYEIATMNELKHVARKLGYPFVLKPADADSSKGVRLIKDGNDLNSAFETSIQFSKSRVLIGEEMVEGWEVEVSAIVLNGQVINLSIGDSLNFKIDDAFIPCAKYYPSSLDQDITGKILGYNNRIFSQLGNFFALTHSEYIVSDNGKDIVLLEATVRGAGAFIASHIVPIVTGIDVYEVYLNAALGFTSEVPQSPCSRRHSGFASFLLPEGVVIEVSDLSKLNEMQGVNYFNLEHLERGMVIGKITDKRSRFGPIVIQGESREELLSARSLLEETLKISVKTGKGIRGPIWG